PTEPPPPTEPPAPTEPPPPPAAVSVGNIVIINVDKREEFVDIRNDGGQDIDLGGWILISEKGNQECRLAGILSAGGSLRIWAMSEDAGQGGFNCNFDSNIWNNSDPDPAVLRDPTGAEVSKR
ncbi:MAG: lamin tail domain-containing protein, partial [Candidatus Promineifilaceae bacterium]